MGKIAMLLKRSPYGDINAAEAVRHALGAASGELEVVLILTDGGVLIARKGQDETGTGFTNLEAGLRDCVGMGVAVHAERESLAAYGLSAADMIEGVTITGSAETAGLIKEAATTMIF